MSCPPSCSMPPHRPLPVPSPDPAEWAPAQPPRSSPIYALQQPEVELVLRVLQGACIVDVDQVRWVTAPDLGKEVARDSGHRSRLMAFNSPYGRGLPGIGMNPARVLRGHVGHL